MSTSEKDHRFFAWFFSLAGRIGDRFIRGHRARLVSKARGTVLELGAGTGFNFPHYPPGVTRVVATEPDRHMRKRIDRAVRRAHVPAEVVDAVAERLPFGDREFDTVIASLVLCSVDDQAASLAEVRRVLRPGGRLLFFEHVRSSDPSLAARQDRKQQRWSRFTGGCHPNRDTEAAIRDAGFEISEIDRFDVPGATITRPHILGEAQPRAVNRPR